MEAEAVSAVPQVEQKLDGPVAAVTLAAGIGAFVLGLLVTLAEASVGVHDFLEFDPGVGPLSGKTIFGAGAFLASWAILALVLRGRQMAARPVIAVTIVLVALGLLGTFPTFFQLFKAE